MARAAEAGSLLAVHVKVDVKPEDVEAFQVGGRTRGPPPPSPSLSLPPRARCGSAVGAADPASFPFLPPSFPTQPPQAASLANATNSVQEPGIARFDAIQEQADPTKFMLVEVYSADDAPAQHKETAHYAAWRDAVAPMMATPRTNVKYKNVFPGSLEEWAVPAGLAKGEAEAGAADELLAVHVFVDVKPADVDAFAAASVANATNSVQEPGIARFDVLQEVEDPTKFCLVEVYTSPDAPAAHKETAHYAAWRDAVAPMMATPRTNTKYVNNFPTTEAGWR